MAGNVIRVLVVDDDYDDYLITRELFSDLNGASYEVDWVDDYDAALQAICSDKYDVYLLDYQLRAATGLDLLRAAMARQCTGTAIILTGHGQRDIDVQAMQAGAVDFLEKGRLTPALLERSIRYALQQKRDREELERRVDARTEELARVNDALRESNRRYRELFDAVPVAVFVCDAAGVIQDYNHRAAQLWGRQPRRGDPFARYSGALHLYLPDGSALPPSGSPIVEVLRTGIARHDVELIIERPDASRIVVVEHFVALRDSNGDIVGAITTFDDITAQKRAQAALEESERHKDEFLAMLGHELRNPLAVISHILHLMRLRAVETGEPLLPEHAAIERQTDTLVRLVEDLLDVHRITRGMIRLKRERVELASIVASARDNSRPFFDARRHTLEVRLPRESLWVDADPVRLGQVLINLLNNAAKYTPPGGQIRLVVERAPDKPEAVIRVQDEGIGLPREMLDWIFGLFAQAERSVKRSAGGLGIGLTLVRQVVELHGGSVHATSPGPGAGSEFIVRLPLVLADALPLPSAVTPTAGATAAAAPRATRTASRRILVVDDNIDAADTLATLLHVLGNEVRSAHDGEQALNIAFDWRPEIVLLDIGLPGMDGLEVCRRLRGDARTADLLLAALTGFGQDLDRRSSYAAGFDAHLVKPVDMDALHALLARGRR